MTRSVRTIGAHAAVTLAVMLGMAFPAGCAGAQDPPIEIELANGSDAERATRDRLLALVSQYDVERFISTRRVRIDENDTPHSHPVLTLHTRHLGDDERLLSVFIHEQFHWWVIDQERIRGRERAETAFEELYPEVPSRADGGASDPESTYLHLVVCDLEFQAMTQVLGADAARELVQAMTQTNPYPWIYSRLLDEPRIREINTRNGMVAPSG